MHVAPFSTLANGITRNGAANSVTSPPAITLILTMLLLLRKLIIAIRLNYLRSLGMNIAKTASMSMGAHLDKTNPRGIHIGEHTFIARGATVLSHDFTRGIHADTHIGSKCFIGVNAIIMPGIKIGDETIIGAGSVVTKSVPSNCIAAGNPARILSLDIETKALGQLVSRAKK